MNIPIYFSLTSIFKKQDLLLTTLKTIINQTIKPDNIFLYLSEEPYILDSGFKDKIITNINLLHFINMNPIINIKWVKNTGSYRKLLPLLKEKWYEDCIIITFDDDVIYDINLVKNLINDYNIYKCVINYRGNTHNINNFNYNNCSKKEDISLYNFPTGLSGILYKPEFFNKTENLIFNEKVYLSYCNKQDDIWFYLVRILNNVKCYLGDKKYCVNFIPNNGLFITFNSINNNNNIAFHTTMKKLKELGYKF